ncbi:MAG: prepilin-type N-terminal cleavage/methylation domain-containing protein [Candidatus Electrothrix sp. AR4]|nr:prepilin-type N-terminal cleavage/methylation domain-containing protein [Candidatus Electrothrix sp. AR4]
MKQDNAKGFSLIEVIMAMAIFAIGAGGLYAMQLSSVKGNTRANQQTGAVTAASQVAEQLMRLDFSDPALTANDPNDPDDLHNAQDNEVPGFKISHALYIPRNQVNWRVDARDNGIKKIEVIVTYPYQEKNPFDRNKDNPDNRQVEITFLRTSMI